MRQRTSLSWIYQVQNPPNWVRSADNPSLLAVGPTAVVAQEIQYICNALTHPDGLKKIARLVIDGAGIRRKIPLRSNGSSGFMIVSEGGEAIYSMLTHPDGPKELTHLSLGMLFHIHSTQAPLVALSGLVPLCSAERLCGALAHPEAPSKLTAIDLRIAISVCSSHPYRNLRDFTPLSNRYKQRSQS